LIVDYNKIQSFGRVSEVLELSPLADKFRAFRWAVREVDGHNIPQLAETFAAIPFEAGKPSVVIANTVKGKGVSFMEDDLAWHYKSPSEEQLAGALRELGQSA
jgi:transketolase